MEYFIKFFKKPNNSSTENSYFIRELINKFPFAKVSKEVLTTFFKHILSECEKEKELQVVDGNSFLVLALEKSIQSAPYFMPTRVIKLLCDEKIINLSGKNKKP